MEFALCSCEPNFVCARCTGIRYQEPLWPDWREEELEARNTELSRPGFEQILGDN